MDGGVIVTTDSDYTNMEIGDVGGEERSEISTLSHSSSVETLNSIKSLSPKRHRQQVVISVCHIDLENEFSPIFAPVYHIEPVCPQQFYIIGKGY